MPLLTLVMIAVLAFVFRYPKPSKGFLPVLYQHRQHGSFRLAATITTDSLPTKPRDYLTSWQDKLCHDCKNITARAVNPHKLGHIDTILQRLNSPAPQSFYVLNRAVQRFLDNKAKPQDWKMVQTTAFFLAKKGYQLVLYEQEGESKYQSNRSSDLSWELVPKDEGVPTRSTDNTGERKVLFPFFHDAPQEVPVSTLQIANQVLDMITDASEQQIWPDPKPIDEMVDAAIHQLSWTMGMDLRGRTSADAAFVFALAGVQKEELFRDLAVISLYELGRVGFRPSFESKYVLQIVEKHAAAGTKGGEVEALYQVAGDCLRPKGEDHLDQANMLEQDASSFHLLWSRPLLWLWRFAARQKKAKSKARKQEETSDDVVSSDKHITSTVYPNLPKFNDPSMPLVVDLGCGMGTSVLGLAATESNDNGVLGDLDFAECNLLGADLSVLGVRFARSITSRWKLEEKLAYAWCPAEECLDRLNEEYPGQIVTIMIQFPTPYRLDNGTKTAYNTQLPVDASTGFMVSDALLAKIKGVLSHSGGKLLVQSNCEDVAVTIRHRAITQFGMNSIALPHQQQISNLDESQQTQRNLQWIQQGGDRAVGPCWSSAPLLPSRASTETEVACHLQGTPIHRCLLST